MNIPYLVGFLAPFLLIGGGVLAVGWFASRNQEPARRAKSRRRTVLTAVLVVACLAALYVAGSRAEG